jgi:hypothetical protein
MERKVKPKLDDFAKTQFDEGLLDGEKLKNVLDFNEFLKGNELTAEKTSKYFWSVMYQGTRLCTIAIRSENYWWIRCFGRYHGSDAVLEHSEKYLSDDLKNYVSTIINEPGCKNCKSYASRPIFSKMFERICWCCPSVFYNPDGIHLEYAKEFVLANKRAVNDIKAGSAI